MKRDEKPPEQKSVLPFDQRANVELEQAQIFKVRCEMCNIQQTKICEPYVGKIIQGCPDCRTKMMVMNSSRKLIPVKDE